MFYIDVDKYCDFRKNLGKFTKSSKIVTILYKIFVKNRNPNNLHLKIYMLKLYLSKEVFFMAVGIIAEYNPFHNGHMYHINKIKDIYPNEEIILILSGNFTQRGIPSIIDKWKKTDIAVKAGINLVVELPYTIATESADYFSYGAITLLERLKVDKLVFGSETNDINLFMELVDTELNNEEFNLLTKVYMKMGENYPTALSKALLDLTGKSMSLPNDLLGISYIKTIKKYNYKIKPFCIKRKDNYKKEELENEFSSATSIREALKNNINIDNQIPEFVKPYLYDLHFQDDYFKFLKYKILMEDDLNIYQTVDEGIGDKIKKEIVSATSYSDLIEKIKSKRYTYSKINRMLNHILCGFTKEESNQTKNIEYIRILGFDLLGQKYLNKVKKSVDIPIISNFSKYKGRMIDIEFRATCIYSSTLSEDKKKELIQNEYIYHPKYK